jgi:hypothetical protein
MVCDVIRVSGRGRIDHPVFHVARSLARPRFGSKMGLRRIDDSIYTSRWYVNANLIRVLYFR